MWQTSITSVKVLGAKSLSLHQDAAGGIRDSEFHFSSCPPPILAFEELNGPDGIPQFYLNQTMSKHEVLLDFSGHLV